MSLDLPLAIGGLLVGVVVGLTGMGGGALMTPMLVFVFGVQPLTAISSDLVVSLFMKPVGALVHLRRGTVHLGLVRLLSVGSIPGALLGAWVIDLMPESGVDETLKTILGIALLVSTAGLVARAFIQMWRNRLPLGEGPSGATSPPVVVVRPVPTVLLGAAAGFMVGLTSVGSGSIVIVTLLFMFPALRASQLVGTDLVQAIPLVAAAAAGHLVFGNISLTVASSLLLGAIPGTFIGAQVSTRAPGGLIRRALAVLLLVSGLRLVGATTEWALAAGLGALLLGTVVWATIREHVLRRDDSERRRSQKSTGAAASDVIGRDRKVGRP